MGCKPTYKGVRYNSLEELYNANGVNEQQKQQAQQLYSQYLEQNLNGDIEGIKKEFTTKDTKMRNIIMGKAIDKYVEKQKK